MCLYLTLSAVCECVSTRRGVHTHVHYMYTQDFLLGMRKNQSCEAHCSCGVGGLGVYSPQEIFSEVASGGFWSPRRIVAEMLLHVQIHCTFGMKFRGVSPYV